MRAGTSARCGDRGVAGVDARGVLENGARGHAGAGTGGDSC